MRAYIYDWEVFRYDWIVVFLDMSCGEFTVFHNDDPDIVADYTDSDDIYIGFNSKAYDQFITKAVCCGFDNAEVKALNDYLISGGVGWQYEPLKNCYFQFNNVDIMDDMQMGLSLKAIEGHLGMSIRESTVPFDIDRPLTQAELEEVIAYCKHDVSATAEVVRIRKNYLNTKIQIGKMAGLEPQKALSMTNAKLTAAFLHARIPDEPWTDERKYKYPENLKREYIPPEVFAFFDKMYDPTIPDELLFKGKLKIQIGDAEATLGYGGIHAAIPHYMWKGGDE